jgi:BirA family transcriptional regulator, biotin operon repressor / biotin---[acetyl-CoA-carboxylase] ligase
MTSTGCLTRCWGTRWPMRAEMFACSQGTGGRAHPTALGHPTAPARATALGDQIALGHPRLHLRSTTSTNDRARALAAAGAPHGTLVSASEQTAGRGRQGRRWSAPAGSALLMSLVLRDAPAPLSLLAAVAVCDVVGPLARVKWPNDIVVEDGPVLKKLAGILIEGRPQAGWAVLGVGVNGAVGLGEMPAELRESAASLGLPREAIEPTLSDLLCALGRRLAAPVEATLDEWRALDALRGREIAWGEGRGDEPVGHGSQHGRAEGIDREGRLVVQLRDRQRVSLDAGEVHLRGAC